MGSNVKESVYVKIAENAIRSKNENGTPLSDTVKLEVKKAGLNEEQIRRAVERVNTMYHLDAQNKMASSKTDTRFVDFDVVDPQDVLTAMNKGEKTMKTARSRRAPSMKKREDTYRRYEKTASITARDGVGPKMRALLRENSEPLRNEIEESRFTKSASHSFVSSEVREAVASPAYDPYNIHNKNMTRDKIEKIAEVLPQRARAASRAYIERVVRLGESLEKISQVEVDSFFKDCHVVDTKEASKLEETMATNYRPHNFRIPEVSLEEKNAHVVLRSNTPRHREFLRIKEARDSAIKLLLGWKRFEEGFTV